MYEPLLMSISTLAKNSAASRRVVKPLFAAARWSGRRHRTLYRRPCAVEYGEIVPISAALSPPRPCGRAL
jgi:hypothetical protein